VSNHRIHTITKGSEFNYPLSKIGERDLKTLLEAQKRGTKLTPEYSSVLVTRFIAKAIAAKVITVKFSAHDFRHYAAIQLYKETKSSMAVSIMYVLSTFKFCG
jgi:integrase